MSAYDEFERVDVWSDTRKRYVTADGLSVDVSVTEYDRSGNSLMTMWVKGSLLPRFIERVLWLDVEADVGGHAAKAYNPQECVRGGRVEIDFDWVLEATPENEERLLEEVLRMRDEGVFARKKEAEDVREDAPAGVDALLRAYAGD